MRILLVEDDEIVLQIMKHRFGLSGNYQVMTASNGRQAMKLAEQCQPELIITDMLMPQASGAELINYVRQNLILDTYIIAVSSVGIENFMQEALDVGANQFVAKPFDFRQLMATVELLNNLAQAS